MVEDAPFTAVAVERDGADLCFLTNVGDIVAAGPEHAIRVEQGPDGTPRPYLHVRRGLEALITRPVFYELVEMCERRDAAAGPRLGVSSGGAWFDLGGLEAEMTAQPASAAHLTASSSPIACCPSPPIARPRRIRPTTPRRRC